MAFILTWKSLDIDMDFKTPALKIPLTPFNKGGIFANPFLKGGRLPVRERTQTGEGFWNFIVFTFECMEVFLICNFPEMTV